ncbi:hypothetical protein M758_10G025700 [Ceratodon purpureus]|nr:hypothetical protein M758_10G025700 [Ceratodon purpureus]
MVSLRELLRAGVGCCSSSWGGSRGGATRSIETGDEAQGDSRKRKGKAVEGGGGEGKKRKGELAVLAGRLLLWNRDGSSHPGSGSNSLDCLAFCDGSGAVCCSVKGLDVGLIGQDVQVNSWTFVPGAKHWDKVCNAEDSDTVRRFKRTDCKRNGKLQEIPGNEPQGSDCGGCLEIHSLKVLEERSVPAAQVPDFPSLCLSPAAANARGVLESPLEKIAKSKPRLRVWGCLHCMSPPFVIPAKTSLQHAPDAADGSTLSGQGAQKTLFKDKSGPRVQSDSQSMLGFLVELRSCCHGTLSCCQFSEQKAVDVGEDGTAAIYFSGAVASWRPLLGEMLGDCIVISGLRRKMIRLGPEKKEFCIYVATRTSLVLRIGPPVVEPNPKTEGAVEFCKNVSSSVLQNQPRDQSRHLKDLDGLYDASSSNDLRIQMQPRIVPNGEALKKAGQGLRSYVGKVTSILMEDQLLELDDKVLLLLTHYKHTLVHGLRVGALVAIRHAHIMTLKTISEKVLVLGACVRSHVWVVLHSVWNAGSRITQASQSRLYKYIGSLPFAWAFWVIHVITSLGCKFKGVYSDKELLGSMKHAGLIRKVLPSMMGTPATLHRGTGCIQGVSIARTVLSIRRHFGIRILD